METVAKVRKKTHSKKWSRYGEKDILPFWIADMDFPSPEFLTEHLISRVQDNYFGYTDIPQEVNQGICQWYKAQYGCDVKNEDLLFSTSVLHSYRIIIETCLSTSGKIIVFTPSYPPLITIAQKSGVEVLEIPLLHVDNSHQIDFKKVKQIVNEDQQVEAIVLCNPHNPVGRVWNRTELDEIKELVQSRELYLIADEIHGDLVFNEYSFNSVLRDCRPVEKLIVLSSPAKSFNVAGIKASYVVTKNPAIKKQLEETFKRNGLNDLDLFAIETLDCLYRNPEKTLSWLESLIEVLAENYHYLETIFADIERAELIRSEGSYLAWIKILDSPCADSDEIRAILKEKYCIDVHEGTIFKEIDGKYIRVNFGCPSEILVKGMDRLLEALNDNAI